MKRKGTVVQVTGPVVDVAFEGGSLPEINEALSVAPDGQVRMMEVAQHIGGDKVRCIMLSPSEGIGRGDEVLSTGRTIEAPVGEATLGRMFNVLGQAIDEKGTVEAQEKWSIHRAPPAFAQQNPTTEILETGIKVIYNTFDSNENLYSRIQTTSYDVIIPSDYAISRFIDEDMLQPLNFDNIPNMKYIDEKYTHLDFDPEQKYSVPYTWGVVGIVYNTKYVDEADTGSWDLLWNPKYANRTAMFNNSRDALGIALMYLGYSLNTTDKDELREAADLIIAGKPVYQGIWMDQILEKLPAEEIVAAPYYNGDAVTMIDENPDLAFYVPKEGTNLFVDAMCIPKNAKNVEGAEKFINFMCSTEAAMANWEYIGYSSPHTGVYEQLDEETKSDPLYFPDTTAYPTEAYTNLPKEISQYYNDLWVDILT